MPQDLSRANVRTALQDAIALVRQAVATGRQGASYEALSAARELIGLYEKLPICPVPHQISNQRADLARADDALHAVQEQIRQATGGATAAIGAGD